MKKLKRIISFIVVLSFSLVLFQSKVSAENWNPFLNYVPVQNVDLRPQPVIPGDYATLLRYHPNIKFSVVGADRQSSSYVYFTAKQNYGYGQEHYVLYENITIFNGNYIDMKVNVENVTGTHSGAEIQIYKPTKSNFLRINLDKLNTRMDLSYEFYIHGTNQQIDYQGVWNYKRVNNKKSVILSSDPTDTPNIYATNKTELIYHTDIPGEFETMGVSGGEGRDQAFTVTFDTKSRGLKQSSILRKTNTGYLKYDQEPLLKMELPTPQIVGHQTKYPEVKYTVAQDMPLQAENAFYPKKYVLKIELDPTVDVSTSKVDVQNIDGQKVNFFTILPDVDNNQIYLYTDDATLIRNSDTSYLIDVLANLKEGIDFSDKYEDGFYHIPATVSYTTQEYNSNTRSANSRVEAEIRAKGKLQSVAQNTSTADWANKTVSDLFEYAYGITGIDELAITNIETKTFSNKGSDKVNVTLTGKISGLSKTVSVPVNVVEEKIATIHFIDENGKELEEAVTKKGFEGQKYDYSDQVKKISGYKYKFIDEKKGKPIKGEFNTSTKNIDIYVVYELDEIDVIVDFIDEEGQPIESEVKEKYLANQTHEITSKEIPGYLIKSVTVDGNDKNLEPGNKVKIDVLDKPIRVSFKYESVHYKLKMIVDKSNVSQRDTLKYQLDIVSGMKYKSETDVPDYVVDKITIPIDTNLSEITKIVILDSSGKKIGVGQVDESTNLLTINLTEKVKVTENIKVTYEATVKEVAVTGDTIKAQATMTANYLVNGSSKEIKNESNEIKSTIAGGLQLVSAPKTIDFGKVTYLAKETIVGNPTIDDQILISDTRSNRQGGWKLYAALEEPLSSNGKDLDGSVIYRIGDDELVLSDDNQEIKRYEGDQTDIDVTSTWGTTPTSDGIKLKFKATDAPEKGQYKGKIRWTLTTGMP